MDYTSLYIDSVSHSFKGKLVINGFYLSLKPGEIRGLLGRNGCGKSTLLNIIFGSLNADYKHLKVNGKIVTKGYKTKNIILLSQQCCIPQKFTLRVAIEFLIHTYKEAFLLIPEVQENLDIPFRDLSGGWRRYFEALLYIYSDATFVLLDEPFSNMSPLLIEKLKQGIYEMTPFKGFILTDHCYEHVLAVATDTILMHNGSNYKIRSVEDLILYNYLTSPLLKQQMFNG